MFIVCLFTLCLGWCTLAAASGLPSERELCCCHAEDDVVVDASSIFENYWLGMDYTLFHTTSTAGGLIGAEKKCPHLLRRVMVWNTTKEQEIILLTNNRRLSPGTIGGVYRSRWQVELFFKSFKQNLKVKTFLGTSENAVQSQLWTVLTAMAILKYLQLKSRLSWSLSNLVVLLRMNLLTYWDLWKWIDAPFGDMPHHEPDPNGQLNLFTLHLVDALLMAPSRKGCHSQAVLAADGTNFIS